MIPEHITGSRRALFLAISEEMIASDITPTPAKSMLIEGLASQLALLHQARRLRGDSKESGQEIAGDALDLALKFAGDLGLSRDVIDRLSWPQ